MARALDWYKRKIQAYRDGWLEQYGKAPSKINVALAVSVAIHETNAGDAWPGEDGIIGTDDDENNWGATTLRSLNEAEQWALATEALRLIIEAGIAPPIDSRLRFNNFRYRWIPTVPGVNVAAMQKALKVQVDGKIGPKTMQAFREWTQDAEDLTPEEVWPKELAAAPLNVQEIDATRIITPFVGKGHADRAKAAMGVLRRAFLHTGVQLPQAVIHCDSTPEDGPYFVWFARFMSEKAGAMYFQTLINKFARSVLESPGAGPYQLAKAMYGKKYGYYTGFFEREKVYEDGLTGGEKNIRAYADRIQRHYPAVLAAA